ncbi:hypothetical protein CROQUDRAFT_99194 [Cronartium quercuum f. sp. fusiforme G11]|uniref:Uncharacterized protein n=1 Tax=Cronartium quercuum f. sp. fusiforme G11 TaxID=708437 RepID=A0A9P6NBD7_9BASI|nr:hypothetical protein CROQUDRAFT_99194 [Cronartium quercuum f. sp. fusiforme G11]
MSWNAVPKHRVVNTGHTQRALPGPEGVPPHHCWLPFRPGSRTLTVSRFILYAVTLFYFSVPGSYRCEDTTLVITFQLYGHSLNWLVQDKFCTAVAGFGPNWFS